jgi:cell wall-associated NlpC family hydrolase
MIRDLIGIPYKTHGRGKEGLDCYGLAIEVLKREKIDLPDVFYDDTGAENSAKTMELLENGIPHKVLDHPEKNCIIELKVFGLPCHIGVYLGNGEFIHCTKNGVVIDKLHRWRNRVKGFYRVNS